MPTQCVADTAGKEISHGSYETKPSFEPPGLYSEEGGLFITVTVGGKGRISVGGYRRIWLPGILQNFCSKRSILAIIVTSLLDEASVCFIKQKYFFAL